MIQLKKFLSLLCVLSIGVICSACGSSEPNSDGISLTEFTQLETGMTLTEAEAIFGGSIEKGTVIEISEEDKSTDDYYEKVHIYKVIGETTGYAELEFTYHQDHGALKASVNGLTSKTQYDLS